ncbi:PREDICTED: GRB2-associated-binding protein 2-like [Ceratosolen solmsi marchali]|uniref:GRB2-associated-binding protein 2-like n=1 Tax=Ceratosolen solmsi marchali TaxID=326594 RepID=A0AAJ7DW10_9HYME|nr:PREDICTED: GRB2-associated-binding protein 2-like [Ceratosolen solmsi marchali]
MDALKPNQEVVHEGWLIKSPPTKLWKARWRQRWFTLRHSGELPGQYFLEYYTDRRCRKLKGRIDLDQCEQVDAGLSFENRKEKYQYMFNVKTPKRIYYLVAENEIDMNKWVDAICQVCGLKAYTQDEDQQCQIFSFESQESPPISPTSIMSGPYIPISECISGPRLNDASSLSSVTVQAIDSYDATKRLVPSPPRSPTTDAESVVTDDEWISSLPNVNWDTFPVAGDLKPSNAGIGSWSVKKRFGKLRIVDSNKPPNADEIAIPPRPPKPSHMVTECPGHNYLNLDGATESSKPTTPSTPAQSVTTNDLNNSGGSSKSRQITAKTDTNIANKPQKQQSTNANSSNADDHVFRYDFDNNDQVNSENASTATYSNLSSPLNKDNMNSVPVIIVPPPPPPLVYRELKPGRKTSDSNVSNELSPTVINKDANCTEQINIEPPSINRKLKPVMIKPPVEDLLQLTTPPGKGKIKSIPSPILMSKMQKSHHPSISDDDNNAFEEKEDIYFYQDNDTFIPASNRRLLVLQYLDLDLETSESLNNPTLQTPQSPLATTVYKTVDFLKTEAFNRTRQRVEEERKQCTDELT